jgi:hypothetical protein
MRSHDVTSQMTATPRLFGEWLTAMLIKVNDLRPTQFDIRGSCLTGFDLTEAA